MWGKPQKLGWDLSGASCDQGAELLAIQNFLFLLTSNRNSFSLQKEECTCKCCKVYLTSTIWRIQVLWVNIFSFQTTRCGTQKCWPRPHLFIIINSLKGISEYTLLFSSKKSWSPALTLLHPTPHSHGHYMSWEELLCADSRAWVICHYHKWGYNSHPLGEKKNSGDLLNTQSGKLQWWSWATLCTIQILLCTSYNNKISYPASKTYPCSRHHILPIVTRVLLFLTLMYH